MGDTSWEELALVGTSRNTAEQLQSKAEDDVNPLVIVSSYNDFGDLAHHPRGTEAEYSVRTYRLDVRDGSLTLLSVEKGDKNPAFTRLHPKRNVLYLCTESLSENGRVVSYEVDRRTGGLTKLADQDARGSSTCYLTIDKAQRFLLLVNYWSSHVVSMPICPDTGALLEACSVYHPKGLDHRMAVSHASHVNHSLNDETAQRERQKDPHAHAVVLDPYMGCVAYVPDLGMDVLHELHFNRATGQLTWMSDISVGVAGRCHGPRYIEFHPSLPVAYVINEIASEVAVFAVDRERIDDLAALEEAPGASAPGTRGTLRPLQNIATIPEAFPGSLNTCGRIAVHPSGLYVVVSNRGHNSLAIFRIMHALGGKLNLVGYFHTRGETPRHFQFDPSGHWLMVANQDTNTLVVFEFNVADGKIRFTNNSYECPSPNFVASC